MLGCKNGIKGKCKKNDKKQRPAATPRTNYRVLATQIACHIRVITRNTPQSTRDEKIQKRAFPNWIARFLVIRRTPLRHRGLKTSPLSMCSWGRCRAEWALPFQANQPHGKMLASPWISILIIALVMTIWGQIPVRHRYQLEVKQSFSSPNKYHLPVE